MPAKVGREKWILYKHTCNYELIKAVALDVKNNCAANISGQERYRMQERLAELNLYQSRNPKLRSLDAINHRINTLEFYMFGYEGKGRRFIFSPLGNLFLQHIKDEGKLHKIFIAMLFGIQFEHPANGTPAAFQLYPFRLIFQLLLDERLECRLYHAEYAYLIPFIKEVDEEKYEELVDRILKFRELGKSQIAELLKKDEHTYVNCVYEWQYYTQKLLKTIGIIQVYEGKGIVKLFHPKKPFSRSNPTGRIVKDGYVTLPDRVKGFVKRMLKVYSAFQKPLCLADGTRLYMDVVKEIYSFYPELLLEEIGECQDEFQVKLLELPKLIEEYANNPKNSTAYLFEDVLTEGFNMFVNVDAQKIGGAGNTDIECLYITRNKKFAVDAKSTENKLLGLNAGRLREHLRKIGGAYTIVITPRYVPAALRDIKEDPIVIILASTFSEYLYNHIYHDVREINYEDFDKIIMDNLGNDISEQISEMTMEKFAAQQNS